MAMHEQVVEVHNEGIRSLIRIRQWVRKQRLPYGSIEILVGSLEPQLDPPTKPRARRVLSKTFPVLDRVPITAEKGELVASTGQEGEEGGTVPPLARALH